MKKLYYSISEISEMLQEEQYTLRYWEKEFDMLKPKKNSAGNRIYSHKDIELLTRIRKLLRDDNLNTQEAYDILSADTQKKAPTPLDKPIQKKEPEIKAEKPKKVEKEKINIEIAPKIDLEKQVEKEIEVAKHIEAIKQIEQELDLSEVEVKEGEMYSLFGAEYDPKISIKKSELQKLYNALADCLEELKNT